MAGRRSGTSTIIKAMMLIAKMLAVYGANDLVDETSLEFKVALLAAIEIFKGLLERDETPFQRDYMAPFGPEDVQGT